MDQPKSVSCEIIATICLKIIKLINNLGVLVMYRTGNGGDFLGIGGSWNFQEKHSPTLEMLASGVFIGFIIYTAVIIIGYCFGGSKSKRDFTDILMNTIGTIMWTAIGGVAMHYWLGYMSDGDFSYVSAERKVGIAMGTLCIVQGALYLVDTSLGCLLYYRAPTEYAVIGHYVT
ncbi:protein snakeskin-like [Eurosta solidaginis]|uniref:protein snakeskin-like n=1 Tax=Eurosta solidaginis TaxID=178769 RepID=UPI00353144D4